MRYPYDIVSFVRTKTFAIAPAFVARKIEDDSPLKVFDDTFSRFIFTIIQDGKALDANVPVDALRPMELVSEQCYVKQKEKIMSPAADVASGGNSPAYTVTFKAGKNKGRTPADILLNESNGREILNQEYKWLQSNLEKYPANKSIMDAIKDAANIKPENAAKAPQPAVLRPVPILEIGARPLTRKQQTINGELMCETYEVSVAWDFQQNYPVRVTVSRYYAPFAKEEDGRLKSYPSKKAKETVHTHTFDMTAEEWMNSLQAMEDARREFRMIHISKMWQMADKASEEAREAARGERH